MSKLTIVPTLVLCILSLGFSSQHVVVAAEQTHLTTFVRYHCERTEVIEPLRAHLQRAGGSSNSSFRLFRSSDGNSRLHELSSTSAVVSSAAPTNDDTGHDDYVKLGAPFCLRLQQLQEFRECHGHCRVPRRYAANPTLGNWVNKLRQQYRTYHQQSDGKDGKIASPSSNSLTQDRIDALDRMGFVWDGRSGGNGTVTGGVWDERFRQLKDFANLHGHYDVPRSHFKLLSYWVQTQRLEYRSYCSGLKSRLTDQKVGLLDSIGFEWDTQWERIWKERYDQLLRYREVHGNCLVPINYSENPPLARWVSNQRKAYRLFKQGRPSRMTRERAERLNAVGFTWSVWDEFNCL